MRIGGTETFARELSLQLGRRGWNSVLCFETEPPADVANFLKLPNITIEILKEPTNFNWAATSRFADILRRHRADILHLHFTGFVGAYPWLAQLLSVDKVFFTDHSSRTANYVPARAPFWKRSLVQLINYPITKVICVSKYGCKCATTLELLPASRYELVYNGVDLSRVNADPARAAEFRRRFNISDQKKIIVQVSWVIPEKGIADLLEVARIVSSKRADAQFVIVGDGPYREQYTKQAHEMGLSNVTWTGLMKDPFGEGVYDAADVVCQLSQWEEVFGWMIAEAMSFGKPVVATRVGGIPELIDEGETGFLVDRGDVNAAAERVHRLLDDGELRKTLGGAGRRKTEAKFNLQTNVGELIGVYGI